MNPRQWIRFSLSNLLHSFDPKGLSLQMNNTGERNRSGADS